ncbi:MAG: hypothetical protein E6J71_05850 [Deltaproteobacteria bacterium]|nr:MAG: hypothetical protein E6J76_01485 [Deltaproteobacteria bacterium]TMB22555.1 MAG: hypothetical protein E6J71_05850 [Deltaproteobacteria bacterium]
MQPNRPLATPFSFRRHPIFVTSAPRRNIRRMRAVLRNRRSALEGLGKILDAGAPEELFTGSDEEAMFLYDLLQDTARARSSSYYWEICRTARRRGVTPEYVVDRAAVLLNAILERRRTDLYRILGVPPLASGEMVRLRWFEVAKRHHPDTGGDGTLFRLAKQAYDVLRDPTRRTEYERFWLRAHGPFERVLPREDEEPIEAPEVRKAPEAVEAPPPSTLAEEQHTAAAQAVLNPTSRLFALRAELDRRVAAAGLGGVSGLVTRLQTALGAVERAELDALASEVQGVIGEMETLRDDLAAVATLKSRLRA